MRPTVWQISQIHIVSSRKTRVVDHSSIHIARQDEGQILHGLIVALECKANAAIAVLGNLRTHRRIILILGVVYWHLGTAGSHHKVSYRYLPRLAPYCQMDTFLQ